MTDPYPSYSPGGLPTSPLPPAQPEKKPGRARKVMLLGTTLLVGGIIGMAAGSSRNATEPLPARSAAPAVAPSKTTVVPKATPKVLKVSFEDGAWLVGRDIAAGSYKTQKEVGGSCYWERRKPGKEGLGAIIQNDIVEGGFPTVVLKAGEEFKSNDCGVWVHL